MFNKKQEQIDDLTSECNKLRHRIARLEIGALGKTEDHTDITCVGIEKQVALILEHLKLEVAPTESLREIKVKDYTLKYKQENNNE